MCAGLAVDERVPEVRGPENPYESGVPVEETATVDPMSEDKVVLDVGPDYDEPQLIERSALPDDARRAALDLDGEHVDGGTPGVTYEVWTVER